jgi:hypothetical protein
VSGTIAGLCVAKNEADIIEAMVRHNLGFLDTLHIVDNDSADATQAILAALADEFQGRLTWEIDRRTGHLQTTIINAKLVPLVAATGAAQVVLLDADEFIRADRQAFRDQLLASPGSVLLPWVTYVPTAEDDPGEPNPILRIRHRRRHERPQVFKATFPGALADRARVGAGNHAIKGLGTGPAVQLDGVSLAHFPVRSREQLTSKVLIGVWNMRLRGRMGRGEAYHWRLLFERIMIGESLTDADVQLVANRYAARRRSGLVADPVQPAQPFALKHSPDRGETLLRNIAAFTERCVQMLEEKAAGGVAPGPEDAAAEAAQQGRIR